MVFNNGDIVLNQAAIGFQEGVANNLNPVHWFQMMSVPTLITAVVTLFVIKIGFKNELSYYSPNMIKTREAEAEKENPRTEKIIVLMMLIIVVLWMTEPLHGLKAWLVTLAGIGIMFFLKVLELKDLKSINLHFILFMVTVFTIGRGLGEAGVTASIFNSLQKVLPGTGSLGYLMILSIVVMVLHIFIGSSLATLSVILPVILPLVVDLGYRPEIITLMAYIIVNIHFLLPYHHASVMIGTGKGFYSEKYMLRFGLIMTPITFALLYFVFFKYWQLLGLL
jgi:di/tricarboxylate transporter